jgi:hypothetical protein
MNKIKIKLKKKKEIRKLSRKKPKNCRANFQTERILKYMHGDQSQACIKIYSHETAKHLGLKHKTKISQGGRSPQQGNEEGTFLKKGMRISVIPEGSHTPKYKSKIIRISKENIKEYHCDLDKGKEFSNRTQNALLKN